MPGTGLTPSTRVNIAAVEAVAKGCTKCRLAEGRTQVVWADGNLDADLLFIGEGPGFHEDQQGKPFVGAAGQLLDKLLAEIGLDRTQAAIVNVVKCRPPGNRVPTLQEAAACAPYLDAQIDLIRPKLIVALGKVAAQRLLNTEASMASLRGKVHRYRGYPVVATYHPSYLLRTPAEKAKAWEDLLFARRQLAAAERSPIA